MLDDLDALPLGDGCFLQRVVLDHRPKMLRIGGQVIALATRPRRRLGLIGAEIANGPLGRLFGPVAVIRVETDLPVTETRRLRLSVAGVDMVIDVAVTEGIGECRLADCLPAGLPPGPAQLRLELLAPDREARSAGITLRAFVWREFEAALGLDVICAAEPSNFLLSHSQHVSAFGARCGMAGAIPMRCRWWPRIACLMRRSISSRPGSRRCAAGFRIAMRRIARWTTGWSAPYCRAGAVWAA